jgi:serine/threonine protein kinase/tetratricopeptide (TPR) repeat protein
MATQRDNGKSVMALFEAALEENPANRSSFLKERCADASVCAEVERLLAEHDEAASFLSGGVPTVSLGDFTPDPAARTQQLSESQVLAGRFRIVRFIAGGGMGEVYEAEDQELREQVAVKTIRAEILGQPNAMARFKREVHLARKVTHPNVCRIFDLFRHKPEGGSERDEIVFISMELLRGKTLAARMKDGRPMNASEALPLIGQMASALAAAHEVGIVHRDFKPGNVVLVAGSRTGTGNERAVVTDFGLALPSEAADEGVSLSTGQGLLGTPAYMAPEQLEGRPATKASDIYALGLVIYEMLTGERAFVGANPLSSAFKRLSEPPRPPRRFAPDLSPATESVILRCLEREPENRFATAQDVADALTAGLIQTRPIQSPAALDRQHQQRKRNLAIGLGLLLLIAAITAGYRFYPWARRTVTPSTNGGIRRSVAVLGFKNLSGQPETAWISTALSEELTTELAAGEKLRTVPGENVARMRNDFPMLSADSLGAESLATIRKTLGSDLVILGSYLDINGQLRVDLRVQDTALGQTIASVSEHGTENQIFDLVNRAGSALREKCGVGDIKPSDAAAAQAAHPASSDAARLYAEGVDKLRSFDYMAARDFLRQAVVADPGFALAHSALAGAWSQLGYDDNAKAEAKRAFELSKGLSRQDSLSIEGQYREVSGEFDKAVEIYRSMSTFFPDDLDYGLRLAASQVTAGQGQAALATVHSLRNLPQPLRDDPRIDLAEARAAGSLSNFKQQYSASGSAAEKAKRQSSRLITGQALLQQCWAQRNLGELESAKAAGKQANDILSALRDFRGQALGLTCIGNVLTDQGDFTHAKEMHENALSLARGIGAQKDIAGASINLGNDLAALQDLPGSTKHYTDALAVALAIDDKPDALTAQNNIGANLTSQGDLVAARKMLGDSLQTARAIGKQAGIVESLTNLGTIFYYQGLLTEAKKSIEPAVEKARELELQGDTISALTALGDVLLAQGDMVGAEKSYRESLAIGSRAGGKNWIAGSQLSLASLMVEQDQPQQAEPLAREAAAEFQAEKSTDQEIAARDVLAQILMAQRRFSEAQAEVESARKLSSQNVLVSMGLDITNERLRVQTGHASESIRDLEKIINRAKGMKLLTYEFQARLAQVEGCVFAKDVNSARSRLETLQRDATKAGFQLIASKASVRKSTLDPSVARKKKG